MRYIDPKTFRRLRSGAYLAPHIEWFVFGPDEWRPVDWPEVHRGQAKGWDAPLMFLRFDGRVFGPDQAGVLMAHPLFGGPAASRHHPMEAR